MSLVVGRIYKGIAEICSDGMVVGNNGNVIDTERKKVYHNEENNLLVGWVGYIDLYVIEWFKNYDKELNIIDLQGFCDEVVSKLDQEKTFDISIVLMNLKKIYEVNIYSKNDKIKYVINERKDFVAIGSAEDNANTLKHFFLSPKSIVNQVIKFKMNAFVGGTQFREAIDGNAFDVEEEEL